MQDKNPQRSPFEESLLKTLSAIDNQIAREMQRSPAELEKHGVQKWSAYEKRVELIVSSVLNALGTEEISLDSILVFSQAMSKTLLLAVEDLGPAGLGKIRAKYCNSVFTAMEGDARRGMGVLLPNSEIN